jgi:hypothetical protein
MGGSNSKITYQKPEYSPVSQAGLDDTLDPIVESGKQLYKKFTATGKNPIPLNLKALGAGTAAGIVAESATQNVLDDLNGGRTDNPYIANLQRLGSRMVGGATSGGVYSGNPAGAVVGAIGGAATDIGENAIGMAKLTPEVLQLVKDRMETNRIESDLQKRFMKPQKFVPIREAIKQ